MAACGDCRFWKPSPHAKVPGVKYGECVAHAPKKHNGDASTQNWALCRSTEWCGDHKPAGPPTGRNA